MGCFPFCCSEEDEDDWIEFEIRKGIKILKNDIHAKNREIAHLDSKNKNLKNKIFKLENMYEISSGKYMRKY